MPCHIFSPAGKSCIHTIRIVHTDWALSNYWNHRAQVLYTVTKFIMSFLHLYCMWDNAHHCHPSCWNSSLLILNASENREQPNAHSCPSLASLSAAGGRIFFLDTEILPDEIWILFLQLNEFFVWVTEILTWTGHVWSLEEAQSILSIGLFKHKQVRRKIHLDGCKIFQPLSLSYIQN